MRRPVGNHGAEQRRPGYRPGHSLRCVRSPLIHRRRTATAVLIAVLTSTACGSDSAPDGSASPSVPFPSTAPAETAAAHRLQRPDGPRKGLRRVHPAHHRRSGTCGHGPRYGRFADFPVQRSEGARLRMRISSGPTPCCPRRRSMSAPQAFGPAVLGPWMRTPTSPASPLRQGVELHAGTGRVGVRHVRLFAAAPARVGSRLTASSPSAERALWPKSACGPRRAVRA